MMDPHEFERLGEASITTEPVSRGAGHRQHTSPGERGAVPRSWSLQRGSPSYEERERFPVHATKRGQFDDVHAALAGLAVRDNQVW